MDIPTESANKLPNIDNLALIKNKKFTPREIDVIACLLCGRAASIPAFLSISARTVETHIHNIMLKIECNSREGILDFIEHSDKCAAIKVHYQHLRINVLFEKTLKSFAALSKQSRPKCTLWYEPHAPSDHTGVIQVFIKHMKILGVSAEFKAVNCQKNKDLNIAYRQEEEALSFGITLILEDVFVVHNQNNTLLINQGDEDALSQVDQNCLFIRLDHIMATPGKINQIVQTSYHAFASYYDLIFMLLRCFYKDHNFDKAVEAFYHQYALLQNEEMPIVSEKVYEETVQIEAVSAPHYYWNFISRWRNSILAMVCGVLVLAGIYHFFARKSHTVMPHEEVVRSDFKIPMKDAFLERPKFIDEINAKLKKQEGIQTVALVGVVGIGGVGKTTIARQFASLTKLPVVWEINAESKSSLMHSFKELAYRLAKTSAQKDELQFILSIKSSDERENELISFVKKNLSKLHDWLLIFDNVEHMAEIKNFFPRDFEAWGAGKVIITTRNANIQNTNYIKADYVVKMDELNENEALILFSKIVFTCMPEALSEQQKNEVRIFLTKIAPFPLDISIAAHYIKNAHISYEQYMERINSYNKDFENLEQKVLQETGDYTKNRYGIITLSLKTVMDENPEFKDFLLLLSLIDSQNIPKSLLSAFKTEAVADSFLVNLRKFSLITSESSILAHNTFSVHRSTQSICMNYLTNQLHLMNGKEQLIPVATFLERYVDSVIDFNVDVFPLMKLLVGHCEVLLSHKDLFDEHSLRIMQIKLGSLYVWLNEYERADHMLNSILTGLNTNDLKNAVYVFQILIWQGVNNAWMGNYEKALEQINESIRIDKENNLNKYFEQVIAFIELGYTCRHLGNYEKAKESLEKSIELIETHSPNNYSFLCQALGQLSIVFIKMGKYKDAEKVMKKVSRIVKRHFAKNDERFAWCFANMGNVYKELGHYEKAKEFLEKNIATQKCQMDKDFSNWRIVRLCKDLTSLGEIYQEMGKHKEAKEILESSLEMMRKNKNFSETHPIMASLFKCLGDVHRELGNYAIAKDFLEKSLIIYERQHGRMHIDTAEVINSLGIICMQNGDFQKAEEFISEALDIFNQKSHPKSYKCLENLFTLYMLKSEKSNEESKFLKNKAIFYLRKALNQAQTYFSNGLPQVVRIQDKLKEHS